MGEETVTWALVCLVCCMILLMRSSCSRVSPSPSKVAPSLSVIVGELVRTELPLPPDVEQDDDVVDDAIEDVEVVGDSNVTPVLIGKFIALICSSDSAMPVAASTTELPVEM